MPKPVSILNLAAIRADYTLLFSNPRVLALCDEVEKLQAVCAEAYQMAGALGAPALALDKLSAAAGGRPIPEGTYLPITQGADVADGECPIGAFDLATTWKTEKALYMEQISEIERERDELRRDLATERERVSNVRAILRRMDAELGNVALSVRAALAASVIAPGVTQPSLADLAAHRVFGTEPDKAGLPALRRRV